jgi:tRNA pseudouridine55 synthase
LRRRRGRPVSGVLLLDKPTGVSSNHALQTARRLLSAAKAGHTGTLDPLATGVLPLCFGAATKFSQIQLDADKTYEAVLLLGQKTSTADAEGEVIETRPVPEITPELLEAMTQRFTGPLAQIPPMYSALKHDGERLYALARRGETVERPARAVHVSRLDLLEFDQSSFEVELDCSKGTYVRSLIEDIGEALGCGAHLTALRRLRVGALDVRQAVTLECLRSLADCDPPALDGCLVPIADALSDLPQLELAPEDAARLQLGQALTLPQPPANGWVAVFTGQRIFIGMAEARDGLLLPRRLVSQEGASCAAPADAA